MTKVDAVYIVQANLCNGTSREISVVGAYLFNNNEMNDIYLLEPVATSSVIPLQSGQGVVLVSLRLVVSVV